MSNSDHRDRSQELVSDETATRDIGGSIGGLSGTMPNTDQRRTGTATGAPIQGTATSLGQRPETAGDPNNGPSDPPRDTLSYKPSDATSAPTLTDDRGSDGRSTTPPMGQTDARDVSTARTDTRNIAHDPNREMGGGQPGATGDTAPEAQQREDPPVRTGVPNTEATDAF